MDNLEKKYIFLETYDLTKLNPEKNRKYNRTIASNEIGSVTLKSPNKQKSRIRWLHKWDIPDI